jgi:ribosomal 30S subunit maturation factor RimM
VGERLLVPFTKSICVLIDLEKRRIEVDLPDGLKDLN